MGGRSKLHGVRAKYAFIKAHRSEFDTAKMCRFLEVSRSGIYEWLRNPLRYPEDRVDAVDQRLWLARLGYVTARASRQCGCYIFLIEF